MPDVRIEAVHGGPEELAAADNPREILRRWDLAKWLYTNTVRVDETIKVDFSYPVLTMAAESPLGAAESAWPSSCTNRCTGHGPALQARLDDVTALRHDATSRGWDSEAARHQRVIDSIDKHRRRLKNLG